MAMLHEKKLNDISEEIKHCERCPLYRTRVCAVPGKGSSSADICFIGEAPGVAEDKSGEPFIGAAGKFLNEMLDSINLSRDDVFITNIAKCRPPKNRDPMEDEKDICSDSFLWKQLEIIKPKLVVLLGRHAMYKFVPADKKIGDVHGMLFKLKSPNRDREFTVLPLYHPAAALYNGGLRETLKKDFKKIPRILKKL